MNVVQPIRQEATLDAIECYLRARSERNALLFLTGIYTGLRIGDILNLQVKNVDGTHIDLREGKTRKHRRIVIAAPLKRELKKQTAGMELDDYLFPSRQGGDRPISRKRAYAVLREAAKANGVDHFGCHSLRKTFGHFVYKQTKDVRLLMEMFNHAREDVTLRYIGSTQIDLDAAVKDLRLTDKSRIIRK